MSENPNIEHRIELLKESLFCCSYLFEGIFKKYVYLER